MTSPSAAPAADQTRSADRPARQSAYIGAVVITFNPDQQRVGQVLAAIAPQVRTVVVVDNGSALDPASYLAPPGATPVHLISLGDNCGIAAAQNIGLDWARQQGCTHVLLLDHDALASPGLVEALLAEMQRRESRGERVAAVGPLIHDPRRAAPSPFFRLTRCWIRRLYRPDPGEHSARTDFLIAAGTLLSLAAAAEVGPMEESLFIDYVDLEWSLRATSRGYRLYGHFDVALDHRLGEEPLELFGRRVTAHSPLRHYYLVRNALALWRLPHTPWHWKCLDALHLLRKCLLFGTLAPRRGEHLRMMLHGLADGLRGRYGRQDQARRGWRVPQELRARAARRL